MYTYTSMKLLGFVGKAGRSPGYDNLKGFLVKHENTKENTISALKSNIFEKHNILNVLGNSHRKFVKGFNEKARTNRNMIKHLLNTNM